MNDVSSSAEPDAERQGDQDLGRILSDQVRSAAAALPPDTPMAVVYQVDPTPDRAADPDD